MRAWNIFCGGQVLQSGLKNHCRYVCYASFLIIAWCPYAIMLQLPELKPSNDTSTRHHAQLLLLMDSPE